MIQLQNENCTVFQSSLYKTTSTVLDLEDALILVDPNWLPDEIEEIAAYVSTIIAERPLYIIYTHSDFDHIIASGAFLNATVIASYAFHHNPHKEQSMADIKKFDEKYYISRNYKPTYPTVDIVIEKDGQKLKLGHSVLTFYLAPGHTNDGLFTIIEPEGIFLSGDYLSDVEFPFIYSSYGDYVLTIKKVQQIIENHILKMHIPGHGNVTEDMEELQVRMEQSIYYLENLRMKPEVLHSFLSESYPFFESMLKTHEENIKMAKQK